MLFLLGGGATCYLPVGSPALLGESPGGDDEANGFADADDGSEEDPDDDDPDDDDPDDDGDDDDGDDDDDPDDDGDDGGSGTEDDPYILASSEAVVAALQGDEVDLDAHYTLSEDVDLSETDEWEPIGSATDPFTGSFDGGGYVIRDWEDTQKDADFGFFGHIGPGGVVRNVGFENVQFNDPDGTANRKGVLASTNEGLIEYSWATGYIEGQYAIGGLVGVNTGEIRTSYSRVEVNGGNAFGGLVGLLEKGGSVTESYAAAVLTNDGGGALIGEIQTDGSDMSAERSFFDSDLNGDTQGVGDDGHNIGDDIRGVGTEDATSKGTFTNSDGELYDYGFDFGSTWAIDPALNDGYPYLQAVPPSE